MAEMQLRGSQIKDGVIKPDGSIAFTADQSMGSHKLTNVTDPVSAQDAATKAYVDAHAGGGGGGTVSAVSVYRATAQTLTSGAEAAITLSDEHFDTDNMWVIGAPTRLTATTAGKYFFNGQIQLGTGFTGTAFVRLYKNGTLVAEQAAVGAGLGSGSESHGVQWLGDLAAADYVEMKVLLVHTSGGTFNVAGGTAATFLQAAAVISGGGGGSSELSLVSVSTEIASGSSWVVADNIEIGSSATLTVSGNLEITGGRGMQCRLDMSVEIQPATLQISNEGTVDWMCPGGFAQNSFVGYIFNSKRTGVWLQMGFTFIGFANTLLNQAGVMAVTSTAGDNMASDGSILSANTGSQGLFHASTIGLGFRFRVPCRPFLQVLRIYPSYFSCKMKYVATLIGGNLPDQTFEIGSLPNAARYDMIKIAYSGTPDMELLVTAYQTANYGSTPNVKMQCATIARL